MLHDYDLNKAIKAKMSKIKPIKEDFENKTFGVCDIPLPMKYINHPKRDELIKAVN